MKEAIMNIFRKWGCCHEWEVRQQFEIINSKQDTTGYKTLYICKKCGKMKWVKA